MKEKETNQTTTGKPKRRARWRHHVVVTLLAVIIMTLFAIITIKVDYLAPVKRALAGFSFTDVYYQIETEGSDPDTCRYITIVDLTRVTERGQIAKVLRDIEAAHPKVIGMDCVFEGEGEDMEGNNAIVEVAEQYKNIVFAKKLQDWKGDSVGYTKATRSFFADFVDITEGTVNMPRLLYDNMKRKYPLAERYKGKQFPSFIAQISNRYADRDLVKGRTDDININFSPTAFRVLQPKEVKAHPELIEGQIVLFGSVYEEVDMHWTPVGKIAGVELLAYSIQSLVEQKEIHKVSGAAFWIISLLIVLLTTHRSDAIALPRQDKTLAQRVCALRGEFALCDEHPHLPLHDGVYRSELRRLQQVSRQFQPGLGLVHDRFPGSVAQYVQFPERLLPVDQGQA